MDDLLQLNRSIAQFWLGTLDARQEAYLIHTPVCLGDLTCSAAELSQALAAAKQVRTDSLRILELNRHYLRYARLAAKDVAAGRIDMLVKMGLNLEQASVLSRLTDDEIALLALVWQGPIVQFASHSLKQGSAMHAGAAKQHAKALLATKSPLKHRAGS